MHAGRFHYHYKGNRIDNKSNERVFTWIPSSTSTRRGDGHQLKAPLEALWIASRLQKEEGSGKTPTHPSPCDDSTPATLHITASLTRKIRSDHMAKSGGSGVPSRTSKTSNWRFSPPPPFFRAYSQISLWENPDKKKNPLIRNCIQILLELRNVIYRGRIA